MDGKLFLRLRVFLEKRFSGQHGGLAGAGATMRTVVNVKSGGRTQLSGAVHALFLFAILMGLGALVQYVPLAVLAGILITVGWGIIDFRGFRDLRKIPRADAFVLIIVFLMTVFIDLLTAVGIGMVVASVLFMKRASDLAEGGYVTMDAANEESPWADEASLPESFKHQICIERFHGPIFFGSITGFNKVMHQVPEEAKVVMLRMKRVKYMDQSGVYAMEAAVKTQDKRVTLRCRVEKGMLMLKVSNALTGEETAELHSTKADSAHHGFGLPGMREIAGRYGGSLEAGPREGRFELLACLPVVSQ